MHARIPAPGTPIWIRQRRWTVERSRLDRGVIRLDVAHGARRLTFLSPFDRPATADRPSRPMRVRRQRTRARLAWALGASQAFDMPIAAIDARVDLLPYQLEPSLALLAGVRRVLIADEVGLGKTIQAGLAIAELQRRRPSCRACVIAPATLVDQWIDELVSRFALTPRRVDQDALDEDARAAAVGTWSPWMRAGIFVASADFLKQPHVIDAMPLVPWDLVVIDEAHGVAGDSQRHDACDELARRARHVLLLTATPHAGDADRYNRLRTLGSLDTGGDAIQIFQRTRAGVGMHASRTIRWRRIGADERVARLIDALIAFEHAVAHAAGRAASSAALLLLTVFRKRAGSTLHALDRTLARRLEWLDAPERAHALEWLQPRLLFDDDEIEERTVLTGESGLPSAQERTWLRRLRVLAAAAMPHDPKIARIRTLLARTHEPAVVFTEFRGSADALEHALRGVRSLSVLHGGLSPAERRDALRRFLDGRASVLIATDVGGQGLNLQARARWVINLELPWNPARLAQRIGRVDRIGQTRRVYATILVSARVERPVVAALTKRAHLARGVMGLDTLTDAMPPVELQIERPLVPSSLGPLVPSSVPSSPGPVVPSSPGPLVPSSSVPSSPGPVAPRSAQRMHWQRRARAMARALARRRAWARRWRGQPLHGARPYVCASVENGSGGDEARRLRFEPRRLAVFTVPIVTANGVVIERHVVALEIHGSISPSLAILKDAAIARATKRLARIRGHIVAATAAHAAIEQAVDAHLRTLRCPEETQLELFSRRTAGDRDRVRATSDAARLDLNRRLADLHAEAVIDAGRPALELTIGFRP